VRKAAAGSRTRTRASIGARRNPEARVAILDAARSLLAERGYSGFSIEEVARRAGSGKPTIYRWWPTKADLIIEVYSADKSAFMPLPASVDLASDLITFTRELWRYWRETPSGQTFKALIAEAQTTDAALEALRDRFVPKYTQPLRQIFAAAADRGEIKAADIEALFELYVGFIWFRLLIGRIDDDTETIERVARIIAGRR